MPEPRDDEAGLDTTPFQFEAKVTFATRAPTAADKGRFWVTYTANSDTTMTLYIRHPVSGTWRNEVFN